MATTIEAVSTVATAAAAASPPPPPVFLPPSNSQQFDAAAVAPATAIASVAPKSTRKSSAGGVVGSSGSKPSNNGEDWTLFENIHLLELFCSDLLWEDRVLELRSKFPKRSEDFFTVRSAKDQLNQIFGRTNPELDNVNVDQKVHPRSKESANLWILHFKKELEKKKYMAKQMLLIGLRKDLDVIWRHQKGELPREELKTLLARQREEDAKHPNAAEREAGWRALAANQKHPADLKNVRNVVDLLKWAHGDRVPVPPADADLPPSTHGGGIRDRLAASRGPMGPTPLPQSMESVMANLHADQQIAADGGRAARQATAATAAVRTKIVAVKLEQVSNDATSTGVVGDADEEAPGAGVPPQEEEMEEAVAGGEGGQLEEEEELLSVQVGPPACLGGGGQVLQAVAAAAPLSSGRRRRGSTLLPAAVHQEQEQLPLQQQQNVAAGVGGGGVRGASLSPRTRQGPQRTSAVVAEVKNAAAASAGQHRPRATSIFQQQHLQLLHATTNATASSSEQLPLLASSSSVSSSFAAAAATNVHQHPAPPQLLVTMHDDDDGGGGDERNDGVEERRPDEEEEEQQQQASSEEKLVEKERLRPVKVEKEEMAVDTTLRATAAAPTTTTAAAAATSSAAGEVGVATTPKKRKRRGADQLMLLDKPIEKRRSPSVAAEDGGLATTRAKVKLEVPTDGESEHAPPPAKRSRRSDTTRFSPSPPQLRGGGGGAAGGSASGSRGGGGGRGRARQASSSSGTTSASSATTTSASHRHYQVQQYPGGTVAVAQGGGGEEKVVAGVLGGGETSAEVPQQEAFESHHQPAAEPPRPRKRGESTGRGRGSRRRRTGDASSRLSSTVSATETNTDIDEAGEEHVTATVEKEKTATTTMKEIKKERISKEDEEQEAEAARKGKAPAVVPAEEGGGGEPEKVAAAASPTGTTEARAPRRKRGEPQLLLQQQRQRAAVEEKEGEEEPQSPLFPFFPPCPSLAVATAPSAASTTASTSAAAARSTTTASIDARGRPSAAAPGRPVVVITPQLVPRGGGGPLTSAAGRIAPKMDKQQMEFEEPEEKKVEADDEADDVKEEEAAADAEVQAATARGVEEEEEMLTTVVVETDSVQGLFTPERAIKQESSGGRGVIPVGSASKGANVATGGDQQLPANKGPVSYCSTSTQTRISVRRHKPAVGDKSSAQLLPPTPTFTILSAAASGQRRKLSSNINKEDIFCQTGRVHFSREDIMLVEKESSSTVAAAGAPYYIRVVTIDEFKSPLVSPVDSPLLAMLPPELASSSDASQHRRSCYRISHSPLNSPLPFSLPEKESGGGGGGEGVVGKKATLFSVPRDDAQTCAEIAGEQQRREELETEAECERQQPPKEDPHEKGEKLPTIPAAAPPSGRGRGRGRGRAASVVVTSRPAAATTTAPPPPPPKAGGNRGEEEDGGEVAEEAEEGDDLHIRLLVYSTGQDAEALLRDRLEREAASARAREAKVEVDDEPPEHDEADGIAAATKIRAAMRRGGGGDGGAPPGAAVGGGGGEEGGAPALVVGLRQNHSSREPIARNILTTLVDDIMTHRHTPIFMHPVEIDVPGYRDAVKKPMDLSTLRHQIELGTVRTFGQFRNAIVQIFSNAVMFNRTGTVYNEAAKEMLQFALHRTQLIQYPLVGHHHHPASLLVESGGSGAGGGQRGGRGGNKRAASSSSVGFASPSPIGGGGDGPRTKGGASSSIGPHHYYYATTASAMGGSEQQQLSRFGVYQGPMRFSRTQMPLPMPVKAEKGCTTDREGMVIKTEAADEQPDDCLQPCSSSSKSTRPIKMEAFGSAAGQGGLLAYAGDQSQHDAEATAAEALAQRREEVMLVEPRYRRLFARRPPRHLRTRMKVVLPVDGGRLLTPSAATSKLPSPAMSTVSSLGFGSGGDYGRMDTK